MTEHACGDLDVEQLHRLTRPKPAPSPGVERFSRLGAHLGLLKRMLLVYVSVLRISQVSFGSLAPPKVRFPLLQRSPLFTTSTVLSRSELVCARQRNPASN
jgi:hypothetical protein